MNKSLLSATVLFVAAGVAGADVYFESEPNDDLGSADFIGSYSAPGDGIVVDASVTLGDIDWYTFTIDNTATAVVASLFDLNPDQDNDGYMGLFDSGGGLIVADDDSNIGLMPSLQAANLAAGTYYLAVTGSPDFDFEGDHRESFEYKLIVGLNIPAPGALAVLGLGAFAGVRRRR